MSCYCSASYGQNYPCLNKNSVIFEKVIYYNIQVHYIYKLYKSFIITIIKIHDKVLLLLLVHCLAEAKSLYIL